MHLRTYWPWSVASLIGGLALLATLVTITPAGAQEEEDALAPPGIPGKQSISVSAELVDNWLPLQVATTEVSPGEDGLPAHGVRITSYSGGTIMLDDARFTHHVSAIDGKGDLVTSGRGCNAVWAESAGEVLHECTADLQEVNLGWGETHEYPVRIHPAVGPLQLMAGTYEVEETIAWWLPGETEPRGEFVVRLTYEVEAGHHDGAIEASINDLARSQGVRPGSIDVLRTAHVTWQDGCFGIYLPDQPCTLAQVPGMVIWLGIDHEAWQYHTDESGRTVIAAAGPFPANWVPGMPIPPGTVENPALDRDAGSADGIPPADPADEVDEGLGDQADDLDVIPDPEAESTPPDLEFDPLEIE